MGPNNSTWIEVLIAYSVIVGLVSLPFTLISAMFKTVLAFHGKYPINIMVAFWLIIPVLLAISLFDVSIGICVLPISSPFLFFMLSYFTPRRNRIKKNQTDE